MKVSIFIKNAAENYFLFFILLGLLINPFNHINAEDYKNIAVLTGKKASKIEVNIAHLLVDRIQEAGVINIKIESESKFKGNNSDYLVVLLGIQGHHKLIDSIIEKYRIPELTQLEPGQE